MLTFFLQKHKNWTCEGWLKYRGVTHLLKQTCKKQTKQTNNWINIYSIMTTIEQQVSDIIEITKLLSNGTTEEYTNSIDVIKDLSKVILDKLSIIDREMYCLAE